MNRDNKILRILAGFLGEALANSSTVDDVSPMLLAVEDLGEHHIKVLEILERRPREFDELEDLGSHGGTQWTTGLLDMVSGMRTELSLVAYRGLVNAGFVAEYGFDGGDVTGETGGTIIAMTELGRTVMQVLRDVAGE